MAAAQASRSRALVERAQPLLDQRVQAASGSLRAAPHGTRQLEQVQRVAPGLVHRIGGIEPA
jgi:hypothetical protein